MQYGQKVLNRKENLHPSPMAFCLQKVTESGTLIKIQYQLIFNAENGPYDISESYVILIFDDIKETKSHREVTGDLFILLWKGTVAW